MKLVVAVVVVAVMMRATILILSPSLGGGHMNWVCRNRHGQKRGRSKKIMHTVHPKRRKTASFPPFPELRTVPAYGGSENHRIKEWLKVRAGVLTIAGQCG